MRAVPVRYNFSSRHRNTLIRKEIVFVYMRAGMASLVQGWTKKSTLFLDPALSGSWRLLNRGNFFTRAGVCNS